jgi:hypothetical protein
MLLTIENCPCLYILKHLHENTLAYYTMSQFASAKKLPYSVQSDIFLVSISPTFYEQLLRQNPFAKKLQAQIVSI